MDDTTRTLTRTPIRTPEAAHKYLSALRKAGYLYHPDDSASSLVDETGVRMFEPDDWPHLDARMDECSALLDVYDACLGILGARCG